MINKKYLKVDPIIEELLNLLEYWKERTPIIDMNISLTTTYNGYQTGNVLYPTLKNNLLRILNHYFNLSKIDFFHMHLIEYMKEGYQDKHDHNKHEDISFILYLNDSDGDTIFHVDGKEIKEKPEKGKIILFDANIKHQALVSNLNKKVAVGGIKWIS